MKRKFVILLTLLFVIGTILAGCGSNGNTGGTSNGAKQVIKIGTQSPLSGPISNMGDAIKTGAELAILDNQEKFRQMGFELQLFPQDDQADPKIGVSNAEALISDSQVLAVVGHLNSGVTRAAGPKYEAGGLPVVSPANTAVDLSESGWKTFHRICARDDLQGSVGAQFAFNDLGAKSVFIVHDKTAYGEGLATEFKKAAEELGMTVQAFEGQENTQTDFSALVNKLIPLKPDIIYFGGMYNQSALLLKQAAEKGFNGYFMTGDGGDDPNFIEIAGKENTKKAFITSASGDASKTDEGKKWIERYKEKFGKDPNNYAVYGYDAALVVLDGLERAIKANGGKLPTRAQVNDAISQTKDFKGVFNTVSFNENGDNVNSSIFIYSFEKGTYPGEFVKSISGK